ncbi:hypothetical protein BK742_21845 [Bacillus thuringiensis serovar pingluonsis]|uniref:Uncharacterized protein n=1 Tax=Bacillus thuringiensis serovar pingluonsis TaxID=180881 RepID=A0A243B794_BACTU|nr:MULTISPECIES: GIY-YIG nuclease family protein [Bacillus cereus group]MEB9684083.1 GIY-YIG nuclease family protein [Bacillus anthracis]OTY39567.1 hypothetical protein BK742_21845 [Bacillus thuringiensis serovar pingluonsis]
MEIIKDIKLKRQYLQMLDEKCSCIFHNSHRVCGIYAIFNKINGKVYIGKTTKKIFHYLRTVRLYALREGSMHNKQLQSDFNTYGEENFEFFIIDKFAIVDEGSTMYDALNQTINYLEVFYISQLKTNEAAFGYNILIGGDNDITITGINSLVYQEKLRREQWVYGDLVGSKELPFAIPDIYIPRKRLKCPNNPPGLGSIIGSYMKKDRKANSFNQYVNIFLTMYRERDYVQAHIHLIPYLLAQQVRKVYPNTPIIKVDATCDFCKKDVSEKVKTYCLSYIDKFQGHIYCFEHQNFKKIFNIQFEEL